MEQLTKLYAQSALLHRVAHPILDRMLRGERTWWLPIWAGPLHGMVMDINLEWEREFLMGDFEAETAGVLAELVKPGMTCFDIGAHVGYFTLLLAKRVGAGGRVVAFEPSPRIMARLERNIARNKSRIEASVRLEPYAVADAEGHVQFYKGGATSTGRMTRFPKSVPESDFYQVEAVTLDAMVYERGLSKPDLLKIDVEHVEDLVLKGAKRLLEDAHPIVVCEIHNAEAGKRAGEMLAGAGYRVYGVEKRVELTGSALPPGGHVYAIANAGPDAEWKGRG